MADPWLATREAVKAAVQIKETARADRQIDIALGSASRTVEGQMHRRFRPLVDTKQVAYPSRNPGQRSWRLWLDQHDLISITTLTSGGTTIPATDYYLEPQASGPPYTELQIDLGSSSSFTAGDSWQRSITIDGLWGHSDQSRPAGALAAPITDTTTTTITVTDGSLVGVGDILQTGGERFNVIERAWVDTGETVTAPVQSSVGERTVTVSDGTAFAADEQIQINAETMTITAILGNDLIVRRAVDGSTVAAHAATDPVWASRDLTVERGALGTTAATHLIGAALTAHVVPSPVEQLVIAQAQVNLGQSRAGWNKTSGAGDTKQDMDGGGLAGLYTQTYRGYGRKARIRAV